MKSKVESIVERLPQKSSLPDGLYLGKWGGYVIALTYENRHYELNTKDGVRTINLPVVVEVKDGIATFSTLNQNDVIFYRLTEPSYEDVENTATDQSPSKKEPELPQNDSLIAEGIEIVQALKAYGMIHPVTGVTYPEGTHQEMIDKAGAWLDIAKTRPYNTLQHHVKQGIMLSAQGKDFSGDPITLKTLTTNPEVFYNGDIYRVGNKANGQLELFIEKKFFKKVLFSEIRLYSGINFPIIRHM